MNRLARRFGLWSISLAICLLGLVATPAFATLKVENFNVTFTGPEGAVVNRAGLHPFAMTTSFNFNAIPTSEGGALLEEAPKDFETAQMPGFVGNPTATPTCSTVDFLTKTTAQDGTAIPSCPDGTAVGEIAVTVAGKLAAEAIYSAVYNLEPSPGVAAKLGFWTGGIPVPIELGLSESPPYEIVGGPSNISHLVEVVAAELVLWGVPASPVHDPFRGKCLRSHGGGSFGDCPANVAEVPFLTLPRACNGPLTTTYAADTWEHPAARLPNGIPDLGSPNWITGGVQTHNGSLPPEPQGMQRCDKLGFNPTITAQPTTKAASSPTGLDFSLDVKNEGLLNPAPEAVADTDIKKAVVTLPEGFSTNPSIAEGLGVCTLEELERETAASAPGEGCPEASKIGTVEVETPVLAENVNGALYVAKPYENKVGSLIALYMVIKNKNRGIVVKQALKVEPNPVTGQLVTIAEELPQLPFSHFRLHFREGTRSPLASPPGCGTYKANAVLTPWSGGEPITTDSAFEIITGPDAGPCPSGGTPPFHPGLLAGTINNAGGSFSPFYVRISRNDSEQEITRFSIKLPPGVTGKLAGIPFCSDAAIAAAKSRERQPHGGQEELEHPSCPQASEVGHTLVGAGVGPSLTYVPGKVYLAGPYHGDSLSIVAITAAKAGPFDLGTVVIREGLEVNPETAEVFVDATGSDPIPHIVDGIPVHLRDIRVYVDRPNFVLNPTNCKATSTASTILGSGTDFASEADDRPVTVTSPFEAADCAALGYKPRLQLKLKGSPKRGGNPALTAILRPRPGDANSKRISVALPRSEFLDQGHIKTICTRVQFKAGAGNGSECPARSIYGHVKAWTPLLAEPLVGNVYLRSSEHTLPDLVLALHGLINFDAVGRIDSVHGGIRNTFETVPDVPIEKVELRLGGGKKSLLENSTNLCQGSHKATAEYLGQNGRQYDYKVPLQAQCKKGPKHKKKKSKAASAGTGELALLSRAW